jgi:hypothetical protein
LDGLMEKNSAAMIYVKEKKQMNAMRIPKFLPS